MHLSFSTGAIYCYPLSQIFRLASAAGFQSVELVLGLEAAWRGPEKVAALARAHGLAIHSLHGPILPLPGWPDGPASVERLVAYAAGMDPAPLVVLHVPRAMDLVADPKGLAYLRALAAWRGGHEERPVSLAVETPGVFHAREREMALYDIQELSRFAQQEGLGLVLDTVQDKGGNMLATG